MKPYSKLILSLAVASSLMLICETSSANKFMQPFYVGAQRLSCYTLDCGHWYVGGSLGVSHVFDDPIPGSGDRVNGYGPGWNANLGYQFNSVLGAELGYTQYYKSRETSGASTVAETTHFASYIAGTGRLPIANRFNATGKLGVGYSYAHKTLNGSTGAGSAGSVSPYYGVGLSYSVTPRVDLVLQWARSVGNDYTGTGDLFSLGATFAII